MNTTIEPSLPIDIATAINFNQIEPIAMSEGEKNLIKFFAPMKGSELNEYYLSRYTNDPLFDKNFIKKRVELRKADLVKLEIGLKKPIKKKKGLNLS